MYIISYKITLNNVINKDYNKKKYLQYAKIRCNELLNRRRQFTRYLVI